MKKTVSLSALAVGGTLRRRWPRRRCRSTAAGATFPNPIYSKWFSEYNKLHPNVQINYQSHRVRRRHPAGDYSRRCSSARATGR